MKLMLKVLILVLVSWMAKGLAPSGPDETGVGFIPRDGLPAAGASGPVVAGASIGHGTWCQIGREPAVFLGRDVPGLGSYGAFAEWCEARKGRIGWSA
jgi:hypothetical protein